jgi:hypothetical protein
MKGTLEVAYEAAGWQARVEKDAREGVKRSHRMVVPDEVGIRASEHLTYSDFPSLAPHHDGSTTYTMNFAFVGPDDYEGGEFYIIAKRKKSKNKDSDSYTEHLKPNKYDAVVFLGGQYLHGVEEIKGGHREMFSTEWWPYPDLPFGSTLWSSIPSNMVDYIERCNDEQGGNYSIACTAAFSDQTASHMSVSEVREKYGSASGGDYANDPRGPPTVKGINRTKDDIGKQ